MESPAGSDEEGDGQEGKGEERWQGVGGEDDSSGTDDHEEGAGDEGELPIPPPAAAEVAVGCQARTQRLCHTYGNGGEWGRVTPGMGMNRGRSTGE